MLTTLRIHLLIQIYLFAHLCLQALNGLQIGERAITVSRAKAPGEKQQSSSGGMGMGMGGPPGMPGMGMPGMGAGQFQSQQQRMGGGGGGGITGTNNVPLGVRSDGSAGGQFGYGQGGMPQQQQPPMSMTNVLVPQGIPSRIVCLENMVSVNELADDQEYNDICADISEECSKYGTLQLNIPRPSLPGCGRVFLFYSDLGASIRAATELAGRKFGSQTVSAKYYDEGAFMAGRMDL